MGLLLFLLLFLLLKRFLLFDYRLNVINGTLIYVLIALRFEVNAHDFDKSSVTTTTTTIKESMSATTTTPTTFLISSEASISLLNRTSSAFFMSDDVLANIASDNFTNRAYNNAATAINVNVDNFQIGTKTTTIPTKTANQNGDLNGTAVGCRIGAWFGRLDVEWICDLLAMTAKNATKSTSTPIETTDNSTTTTTIVTNTTTIKTILDSDNNVKTNLQSRILSRSKRFLSFPEGSSFSVAVCFTVGIIGNPRFNYMAFGLNWGVAYDLPNTTWVLNHLNGFSNQQTPIAVQRRRTRRALYKEIEVVVNNMGYNGRDCVLRALCESCQYFRKNKLSMIGEMLRIIFSLPKQRLFTRELHEQSEIEVYDHAYRRSRDVKCDEQYDCTFSLLELAFGKYSTPPAGYYQ